MLDTLASHNDDIRRLMDKGYAVSLDSNCLVIRDIPYLDDNKALQWGAFISKLIFLDQFDRVKMVNHEIFFCGSHPHQLDGTAVSNLGGGPVALILASPDLVVQRSFSHRPENGYVDLFEKIEIYTAIIAGPAITLHGANPFTFRIVEDASTSVFKVRDTLTSRAEIGDLNLKFNDDVIAIVGLGGTGSYLLDFLVKTPVREIRAFDLDWFHPHNGFRSPGRLNVEELGKRKTEIYHNRYENFRHGFNVHSKFILADSTDDLDGVTFAFICVDKGVSRASIIEALIKMKIPFIDVGMGLEKRNGPIGGTVRTTYFNNESAQELLEKELVPLTDLPDDVYRNNIQIAELNALNACFAVIKFKQLRGFYADDSAFHHMLFTLDNFQLAGL